MYYCINSKKVTDNNSEYILYFGKTGGFTNVPMEYVINPNGNITKIMNDSTIKIKEISAKKLKDIDKALTEINFKNLKLNEYGNITYYIRVKSKSFDNIVHWTDTSNNKELKDLYNKLLNTLK